MNRSIGLQIKEYNTIEDINIFMSSFQLNHAQIFLYPCVYRWNTKISDFLRDCLVVHASYLINFASKKVHHPVLIRELAFMQKQGLKKYVIHLGSWKQHINKLNAILHVIIVLKNLLQEYPSIEFIIENMANPQELLGADLEDLKIIADAFVGHDRVTFCFDTAHAYAAGYEIDSLQGYEDVVLFFREHFFKRISLIHLNDTRDLCGSGLDEHVFPSCGRLGNDFLTLFFKSSFFNQIPIIIEQPALEYRELYNMLEQLDKMRK